MEIKRSDFQRRLFRLQGAVRAPHFQNGLDHERRGR